MEKGKVSPIVVPEYEEKDKASFLDKVFNRKNTSTNDSKNQLVEKRSGKKSKKERVLSQTTSLLPFLQNTEEGIIKKEGKGVMDILQKETTDLNTLSEDELTRNVYAESTYLRAVFVPHKVVAINLPPSTSTQQEYWFKLLQNTDKPLIERLCKKKIFELQYVEKHRNHREFFYFIFADNFKELRELRNRAIRLNKRGLSLQPISLEKKEEILFQMNNQNSKL